MSKPNRVIRKSVRVKFEKTGGGEINIPAVRTSQCTEGDSLEQPSPLKNVPTTTTPGVAVETAPLNLRNYQALVHLQEMKCGVLRVALRDLLAFFERHSGEGWTATDVDRLQQIRQLAK